MAKGGIRAQTNPHKEKGRCISNRSRCGSSRTTNKAIQGAYFEKKGRGEKTKHLADKVVHAHLYSQNMGAEQVGLPPQLT